MALLALINNLDKNSIKFFLKIDRWLKTYFLFENEFRSKIQGLIVDFQPQLGIYCQGRMDSKDLVRVKE